MTIKEYQELAMRTATKLEQIDGLRHGLLMLASEAGECCGLLQKTYQGHELNIDEMVKELGDCCWAIARVCDSLGITMDLVMEQNILKLMKRYPNGFSANESINRSE